MIKIIFIILTNFLFFTVKSQNIENIDSFIRVVHPEIHLSTNFHLFTYPLAGATTTFAPQIIKGMKEITTFPIKRCDEDILFVFDDRGAIAHERIIDYFKKVFLWGDWQINQIKYVFDNQLFSIINKGGELVQQLYFYNGLIQYNKVVKLHSIQEKEIQHAKFSVADEKIIKILDTSTIYQTRDDLIPFDKNEILILSDIEDELVKINLTTGEKLGSFSTQNLNSSDVFCRYIAKNDTNKCDFAKKFHDMLKKTNRKTLDIIHVEVCYPYIYCAVSLEEFQKNEEIIKYKNDEGQKKILQSGDRVLTPFLLFLTLDQNLNLISFKVIDENSYPKYKYNLYSLFGVGFKVIDNKSLIVSNAIEPYRKNSALSEFSINDTSLFWKEKSIIPTSKEEQKKNSFYNLRTFYFEFANKSLFSYDYFGNIYSITDNKIIYRLAGYGSKPYKNEKYALYAELPVKNEKMNFEIHSIAPILDGKYLAIVYKYKGKIPLLEIIDSSFNTIDVIRLDSHIDLKNYFDLKVSTNLTIMDDKIYILTADKKNYFINSHQIKMVCQ